MTKARLAKRVLIGDGQPLDEDIWGDTVSNGRRIGHNERRRSRVYDQKTIHQKEINLDKDNDP